MIHHLRGSLGQLIISQGLIQRSSTLMFFLSEATNGIWISPFVTVITSISRVGLCLLTDCCDLRLIALGRRILVFPKGNNVDHLSIYLDVADSTILPYGWSRYNQFSLSVINQIHDKYSIRKGILSPLFSYRKLVFI